MLLQEALQELKAGKSIARDKWKLEDGYLKLLPGMEHVWKITIKPTTNAGNYIFSYADLTADDWNEFCLDEKQKETLQ